MTLSERLRRETRELHEETELLMYADQLANGTLTLSQYRQLLRIHWQYHRALEAAVDRHPAFFSGYAPELRRKTPWLRTDFEAQRLPLPTDDPELFADWDPVELIGAAYVGEGSMLGGRLIRQHLKQNETLFPLVSPARFYEGYGEQTAERWKSFARYLETRSADQPDRVVEAARRSFRLFQSLARRAE